ncbi:MAG: hypothetical protein JRE28_01100 [Deltaproteobacteria bacterium]|nr:hypothetical protein [Deltaproteobacteria bacterium]
MKRVIIAFWFLIMLTSSACAEDKENPYSFLRIRKEIRALEAQLKPIKETPASFQSSPYGPGDYERLIEAGGRSRRYELHIPLGYTKNHPWPVVINYHGGGGRAATARIQSRMDKKADSAGFIVVYPEGTGPFGSFLLSWNAGACCGYAVENNVNDVQYSCVLLDDLARLFNIDPYRIYATGLSNGAFMSYRVACELADRIAAIAPIAGVMTVNECRPSRPVSIIHFHGTLDKFSPYNGGVGEKSYSKVDYLSVNQTIQIWLQRNKIPPTLVKREKKNHAVIEIYQGPNEPEVVLVTLVGMGHTWPKGRRMLPERKVGLKSHDISANDLMWDFFQRHSLESPTSTPPKKN